MIGPGLVVFNKVCKGWAMGSSLGSSCCSSCLAADV